MSNGVEKFLDAAGKAVEIAPTIYEDALQDATKESGQLLKLIPQTINAALVPLRQWIAHKEYNMAKTEKLLEHKLKNVDPKNIVSPEPYVAVPAIQSLSYAMNNEELRNLYANLLAKSMNSETKDNVHPSFSEIIKQLSPLDAKVFKIISENEINPLISISRYSKETDSTISLAKNITLLNIADTLDISISINNLERLNLINIPWEACYKNTDLYKPFKNLDIYKNLENNFKSYPQYELVTFRQMIDKTDIGKLFYKICIQD